MSTTHPRIINTKSLENTLAHDGAVFVARADMLVLAGAEIAAEWPAFASSWNELGPDKYMADGGRYRLRRHAVFSLGPDGLTRQAHQPHYQSRDYNALNGGIQRWFEPVSESVSEGPIIKTLINLCRQVFTLDDGRQWHTEMHQFRIEPAPDGEGRPTPEGLHRDGVDWVGVFMIDRVNVAEGVTRIEGSDGVPPGFFCLTDALDTVFIDDTRVRHAVTPIRLIDNTKPGHRDVLVLTFKSV
jgi:hypothetical protein